MLVHADSRVPKSAKTDPTVPQHPEGKVHACLSTRHRYLGQGILRKIQNSSRNCCHNLPRPVGKLEREFGTPHLHIAVRSYNVSCIVHLFKPDIVSAGDLTDIAILTVVVIRS